MNASAYVSTTHKPSSALECIVGIPSLKKKCEGNWSKRQSPAFHEDQY